MDAVMMALPPENPDLRAGGLPIRLTAADAIRRARAAFSGTASTPPAEVCAPAPAVSPTPVISLGAAALATTLRGFTIDDLYLEAVRQAQAAAQDAEDLEGLAAGRAYGDRSLAPGFLTPDHYRRAAAEARRQAEMAGATADLLRRLAGRETGLAALLAGGSHV